MLDTSALVCQYPESSTCTATGAQGSSPMHFAASGFVSG